MALRQIRIYGDEKLTKVCRPVKEMTPRIQTLIQDMLDTMYNAEGVGLAAPQVGVLRRIIVVDIGEGPIILINPEILETEGEQTGQEGCLSLPGQAGDVTRPNYVKVKALNQEMEPIIVEGEELLARALCHECDHLDGIMYVEKVIGELYDVTNEEDSKSGEEGAASEKESAGEEGAASGKESAGEEGAASEKESAGEEGAVSGEENAGEKESSTEERGNKT